VAAVASADAASAIAPTNLATTPPADAATAPVTTTTSGSGLGSGTTQSMKPTVTITPITTPSIATVVIDTVPSGASIIGPDNRTIGITPTTLKLPITATALTYELKLAGYRKKTKQFVVTGDAVLEVALEKLPVIRQVPHPHPHHGGPDDLEPP
jgi:hypothetical protein